MLDIKPRENKIEQKAPVAKEETPKIIEPEKIVEKVTVDDDKELAKITQVKKSRQKKLRRIIMTLFGVSIFFMLTTVYFGYEAYRLNKMEQANILAHPDVPTTPNQIIEAVSHHIVLPDGTPQIAAVQDAKKLSAKKTLFKNAANGDVVILFDTMIILYRPSQDIIVAVGDIFANQTNDVVTGSSTGTTTAR